MTAAQQAHFPLDTRSLDLVIEAGFEPCHHQRHPQRTQRLGTSRTPVRSALSLLTEQNAFDPTCDTGTVLRVGVVRAFLKAARLETTCAASHHS